MLKQKRNQKNKLKPKGKKSNRASRKDYYKKISKKRTINRWKDEEYLLLVDLVSKHGETWEEISSHFDNKSAKQCMQKFKNSARSAKKGNWTRQEDEILMKWIKKHGANKWTECSKDIEGRCGKQCRERWVNICLLYTSPSPRDLSTSRMPSSA